MNLLDLAFCHRSFVNESSEAIDNNERLEFLGDSVLGLVVADYLFHILPDQAEGDLARIKAHVVSEDSLAAIALDLGIDALVRVGKGENMSGGRTKKSLLSDCMEAIIGASYLDAGFDKTVKFILRHLKDPIDTVLADKHRKDYKSLLQKTVQRQYRICPKYIVEKKTGPEHQKTFWVKVIINDNEFGPGMGSTKKSAEQEAARLALEVFSCEDKRDSNPA